jgi:hypothetical protein
MAPVRLAAFPPHSSSDEKTPVSCALSIYIVYWNSCALSEPSVRSHFAQQPPLVRVAAVLIRLLPDPPVESRRHQPPCAQNKSPGNQALLLHVVCVCIPQSPGNQVWPLQGAS